MPIATVRRPVRHPVTGTLPSGSGPRSCHRLITAGGRALSALALVVLLAGCGASLARQNRADIGRATLRDIQVHVPEILADHGYSINQRRETRTRIYYETSWLYRAPFDDEVERGVQQVRTRFIVQGRRGGSDFYDVEIRVENSVRGILPSGDWSPLATPDFEEHMRSVSDELMMNINAGVRIRGTV